MTSHFSADEAFDMSGPALRLEDVVFRFYEHGKRNVLDHASLQIADGGVHVIMGASGCGKSTLAAVAAGLYPENGGFLIQGTIEIYGRNVREMMPADRAPFLSVLFQNPDLQFCMRTLREEMRFCMENLCVLPGTMDERIRRAAEETGVMELLDRELMSLSGGEKQRASLACLYVMESRCVILDEAFANIDEDAAKDLIAMLGAWKAAGRTIIAIDHQLMHWTEIADEIIVLGQGGCVKAQGINPGNVEEYRELFEELGLLLPARAPAEHTADSDGTGKPAFALESVSVPAGQPRKRFGRYVTEPEYLIRDTSCTFPRGMMSAVLGPSGSGKTTTFLAMLRQHPYEGKILLDGADIAGIKSRELYRRVGIVFQNPANQFITQNVREEIIQSIVSAGKQAGKKAAAETTGDAAAKASDRETPEQQADRMLDQFGLLPFAKYSPYMLSQGQQRRLAVLAVIAGGQSVLLLDEPTYGQDKKSTDAIMQCLQKRVEEDGLTVIFITHDRTLAEEWAAHRYELRDRTLVRVR